MTFDNIQINEGWLRDGIRLEKPTNEITLNHDSGLFSKWIKNGEILYKNNDTSTIQGYRSRVSRGVDHRIEVYNTDTGERLIIEVEDKNLNETQQRSLSFWIQQLNFSPDADIKIVVCPRGCLTKRTLYYFEKQKIIHIDSGKKLRQDSEMYDHEWRNSIRQQFKTLYQTIKSFMNNKKPLLMCSIPVDYYNICYNSVYNSLDSTVEIDNSLTDNSLIDKYKIEYNRYNNIYIYNNYTNGFDTPKKGDLNNIYMYVFCKNKLSFFRSVKKGLIPKSLLWGNRE